MRTRALIVAGAVIAGLVAAYAAYFFLEGARSQLQAQAKPVEVYVATQDIPRGMAVDEIVSRGLAERQAVPARFVASNAISSVRKIDGQVLANPVSKGEQLTTARFQFPTEAGLSYSVPDEYVGMSLPVDESHGLAGLVKPGDNVVVIATINISSDAAFTVVLVPKARVLAVNRSVGIEKSGTTASQPRAGTITSSGGGDPNVPKTVTVALSTSDAVKCALAAEKGKVWLALMSSTATSSPATLTPATAAVLKR